MSNLTATMIGPYRGFIGTCEYSEEDDLYYGWLVNTDDCIIYEGKNTVELYQYFKESVDDYIDMLKWLRRC